MEPNDERHGLRRVIAGQARRRKLGKNGTSRFRRRINYAPKNIASIKQVGIAWLRIGRMDVGRYGWGSRGRLDAAGGEELHSDCRGADRDK